MNNTAATKAVIKAQKVFWIALKEKDAGLFEQVLAEDFVSRSPGEPNQSRRAFIKTLTSFPATVASVGSDDLEVHLFGEVAVLTGVQVAQLRLPNGATVSDTIAITNVYRRSGGRWYMVLAHAVQMAEHESAL